MQKNKGEYHPYLRNVNVRWGNFDLVDTLEMRFEESEYERYIVRYGDLIICEGGEPGRCAVWKQKNSEIRFQKALHRVRPYCGISTDYLYFMIWRLAQSDMLEKYFTGSTIKHLTGSQLSLLPIFLPPLAEQSRIVAVIEAAFAVIDEIERNKADLLSTLAAAKSKILSLAIRGKLVPQDPDDEPASVLLERIRMEREKMAQAGKIKPSKRDSAIFKAADKSYYPDLPEGWAACRLNQLGQIVGGGTPRTDEAAYWDNGSISWLTPADLSAYGEKYIDRGSRNITPRGLTESSAVLMPAGSILFSSRAPIGYMAIAAQELCTNQGFKSLIPHLLEINEYLYWYLKAQIYEIISRASGTTFQEISGREFGETIVSLPPLAEQKRLVRALETALAGVNELAIKTA